MIWKDAGGILVQASESPDGKYVVEVYADKEWFAVPGGSGSGSGYVTLVRKRDGEVLRKQACDGISTIDTVRWSPSEVEVKLFATWELH